VIHAGNVSAREVAEDFWRAFATPTHVTPAEAGVQLPGTETLAGFRWIPAFAGMT
jgi:hypothetical protein